VQQREDKRLGVKAATDSLTKAKAKSAMYATEEEGKLATATER
jgi:hypothetical protein